MKDVLTKDQIISLINLGFDVPECKYYHVNIRNDYYKTNDWIITNEVLNRGDRMNIQSKEGTGFKVTTYDEVIDVLPALTIGEVLDHIVTFKESKNLSFRVKDGMWEAFYKDEIIDRSDKIDGTAYNILKYLVELSL